MAGELAFFLTALYSVYDVVFQPLLSLGPYASLVTFSIALAGVFSVIYWRFLDVERQEELKQKLQEKQSKMKEARKNGDQEEASDYMQETLKLNQDMMKLNIKPMVGTMVFVALFFPWLGATYAPNVQVSETAGNGVYNGSLSFGGSSVPLELDNSSETLKVTVAESSAETGGEVSAHGINWNVGRFKDHNGGIFSQPRGPSITMWAEFVPLPFSLPIIGDELNWLGFYILLAMPLTFAFRKALGIA